MALVAVPLTLLVAAFATIRALLFPRSRTRVTGPRGFGGSARGASDALCEFVRKMSLDDSFDVEDARMAGLPVDGGVTVEGLLSEGLARGWLERRGERYAVTARGRAESEALLRRRGL